MLLFDDAKRLEKTLGPDAAEAIVHILEKQAEQQAQRQKEELATKADLQTGLKELELKLTQRMFAAAGVIIAVLGFLIKF